MNRLLTAAIVALGLITTSAFAANAECTKKADEKKLAGAARTSFVTKCEKDAGHSGASAACEASAKEKKLAGAAKTSHVKKCMEDSAAKKS